MKTIVIVAAGVALSGCSTVTQEKVLTNLEGCKRIYNGAVQGGILGAGFTGTVNIECPPRPASDEEPLT